MEARSRSSSAEMARPTVRNTGSGVGLAIALGEVGGLSATGGGSPRNTVASATPARSATATAIAGTIRRRRVRSDGPAPASPRTPSAREASSANAPAAGTGPRRLRHRRGQDPVDRAGQLVLRGGDRGRRLLQVRVHQPCVVLGRERRPPGEAFEQHAPERVHVGPRVRGAALELLGRRVVERADELPRPGDARVARRALREPEVREVDVLPGLRAPLPREQHVARLDVAVHEPLLVRGVEGRRDLPHDGDGPRGLERSALVQQRAQIGPLHVAHRDEQVAAGGAGLVDRDHVRVVERRGEPGLADEPLPEAFVLGELGREHLERDLPLEPVVLGEVDDAHAAAAERALDPVARDLGPRLQVHPARTEPRPRGLGRSARTPSAGAPCRICSCSAAARATGRPRARRPAPAGPARTSIGPRPGGPSGTGRASGWPTSARAAGSGR